MLSTTDAFMYAFSEFRKRRDFWIPIALLYVLLGSIRVTFPNDGILFNIVLLIENLLYIVVIRITIKAIENKEYNLMDILLKPIIFIKAIIYFIIIIFICGTLLAITGIIIAQMSVFFLNNSTILGITLLSLLLVYMVTKLFFAQYYFFNKKISIWQSLKESWKDSNYKVLLSILLSTLWMVILCIPFLLLDIVLRDFYLHSYNIITPIGQLAGAHLYMQLQNKKDPM